MRYWIISKTDFISKKTKSYIIDNLPFEADKYNPDIVISIGGDGTFLRALHAYPEALIIGIHTGHLGFYSAYSYKELDKLIADLMSNNYEIKKLPLIKCEYIGDESKTIYAVNEITLISPPRTLVVDVYINDNKLEEFRGTGLCISTPSGSTAYNRSLGGAIIDHELMVMQLTEMAGINSAHFETLFAPLVLNSDYKIRLVSAALFKNVLVTADNLCFNVGHFKELVCSIGTKYVKTVGKKNSDFIDTIKKSFLGRVKSGFKNQKNAYIKEASYRNACKEKEMC